MAYVSQKYARPVGIPPETREKSMSSGDTPSDSRKTQIIPPKLEKLAHPARISPRLQKYARLPGIALQTPVRIPAQTREIRTRRPYSAYAFEKYVSCRNRGPDPPRCKATSLEPQDVRMSRVWRGTITITRAATRNQNANGLLLNGKCKTVQCKSLGTT